MMTDGIFGAATNEVKTATEEGGSELWNPTEGGGCEGTSHLRRQFTKEKRSAGPTIRKRGSEGGKKERKGGQQGGRKT